MKNATIKTKIAATVIIAAAPLLYWVYLLAGFNSQPIVFAPPPDFVSSYATKNYPTAHSQGTSDAETDTDAHRITTDYFNEAAMVRNVIVNDEPPLPLINLFSHPNKVTRVKTAFAFGEVNIKLSHDEGTGFDEKRDQFWLVAENHDEAIQHALFEALIASAKEGTETYIPYALAWWMQTHKAKTLDMLTWAAKHHPKTWVRNFCVYYIVQYGDSEPHAQALLNDRIHDPVFEVRKQVMDQRLRRLKEWLFGKPQEN